MMNLKHIKRVFIANRGEIVSRIIRTCKQLQMETVVAYAPKDKHQQYLDEADFSYPFQSDDLAETYLNIPSLIHIAQEFQADAIHPGYGFLSESEAFAQAVSEAKIIWIGPSPEVIKLMGNKRNAREWVSKLGVPVPIGFYGDVDKVQSNKLPFPLIVKAEFGGGGKGMRIVYQQNELNTALTEASGMAERYFSNGTVYVEQYIPKARHIEVQVLGDAHGNVFHLYERECSVQRNYQKVVEEAPAANLSAQLKNSLYKASLLITRSIQYHGVGTVEFIVDDKEQFWFLEMNTRIQVEHPVTEQVTGLDLIELQLRVADGQALQLSQEKIKCEGHAIESRLYAEDPKNGFLPSPGNYNLFAFPKNMDGLRVDSSLPSNGNIAGIYDPMIAKVITHAESRHHSIDLHLASLKNIDLHHKGNNKSFLSAILNHADFKFARVHTQWIEDNIKQLTVNDSLIREQSMIAFVLVKCLSKNTEPSVWNQLGFWRNVFKTNILVEGMSTYTEWTKDSADGFTIKIEDKSFKVSHARLNDSHLNFKLDNAWVRASVSKRGKSVWVELNNEATLVEEHFDVSLKAAKKQGVGSAVQDIASHLPGKVIAVALKAGDIVKKGDKLLTIESMKTENHILVSNDAKILEVYVEVGQQVNLQHPLIKVEYLN